MESDERLEKLVDRCQRGERVAFEDLFRQFQPRLRYYIRRLGLLDGDAEDVLQDIWISVVRRIAFLRDRKAFVAWLYTVARHEVYGRARIRDPFVELSDEHLGIVTNDNEPVFGEEDAERIHRAMATLKPHHREILTLSFIEDFSHSQIAEILGLRAGTVRSRVHYAKQALRTVLERNHE
jgi:RNA polymerase sigma-70 factor (ECF subfamily)